VKTYEVVATRSGRWWALEVTGLRMGYSQARRLADIEVVARELSAVLTEVAEDSFGITVRVERGQPPEYLPRASFELRRVLELISTRPSRSRLLSLGWTRARAG
jgi:hypothetical protein